MALTGGEGSEGSGGSEGNEGSASGFCVVLFCQAPVTA